MSYHTKCAVLVCCERAITFVPEIIWRVTFKGLCSRSHKFMKLRHRLSFQLFRKIEMFAYMKLLVGV